MAEESGFGAARDCVICLRPQAVEQVAGMLHGGRRICRHLLHQRCAKDLLRARLARCPLCSIPFSQTVAIPDVRSDPSGWFRALDLDRSGTLSHQEVFDAIGATLPLDDSAVEGICSTYTQDTITEEVFIQVGGLRDLLVEKLPPVAAAGEVAEREDFSLLFDSTAVRVLRGVAPTHIWVGGVTGHHSYGQNPPGQGDAWEMDFVSEGGSYRLIFWGGGNPHHGILTVSIDGQEIGNVDQFELNTIYPTRRELRWEGPAGQHTLRGCVDAKRRRSVNYWICLFEICFEPYTPGEEEEEDEEEDEEDEEGEEGSSEGTSEEYDSAYEDEDSD